MIRKIVNIDEELCNGCGACATACHEHAIEMVDGKAHLIKDDFCDGFGDCLPECPAGAITITEREAAAYDEEAVKARQAAHAAKAPELMGVASAHGGPFDVGSAELESIPAAAGPFGVGGDSVSVDAAPQVHTHQGGCPGSRMRMLNQHADAQASASQAGVQAGAASEAGAFAPVNRLRNWPVQIKLAPTQAPYFDGANLLVAADCTAYAYARFHEDFIKNRVALIGCPKLDDVDYTEKLQEIIANNDIKSLTIVRMEVPCCGGLEYAAKTALQKSGKFIPWQCVTLSLEGEILD